MLMGFQNIDIAGEKMAPVLLEMAAGEMCCHDGYTVHGSVGLFSYFRYGLLVEGPASIQLFLLTHRIDDVTARAPHAGS